jgi:hypothetical protein
MNSIMYVGLDVHKATVAVAVAEGGRGGEVCDYDAPLQDRRGVIHDRHQRHLSGR